MSMTLMDWSAAVLGVSNQRTSHAEKWISALGAALGIAVLGCLVQWVELGHASILLATSMGASAVLVFAVPHGALSQPWPVLGGYLVSAFIGVFCAQMVADAHVAAALAAGGSVLVMYYLRCLHPPGGAAALAAVFGGNEVRELGYLYVLNPILVSAFTLVIMSALYSGFFPWRRYPVAFARHLPVAVTPDTAKQVELTDEDFEFALQQMESYIDIAPDDLKELCELAMAHAARHESEAVLVKPASLFQVDSVLGTVI